MNIIKCLFPLVLLLNTLNSFAASFETKLENGMRVIVVEDHRAPTVAHMVWYQAGSIDETSGATGVAHALEHMMFKGTPQFGAGEFSRLVALAGGVDNAFTSQDYTAYFQQIPKEKLGEMMRLEADRMRHLTLDEAEFKQEIKVIMEERRMRTEDNPQAALFEQMNAVAIQAHPARTPVIGFMNDLENMHISDLRAWYARWYAPNNAILVIVGDIFPQEALLLAKEHYGKIPAREITRQKAFAEPPQKGVRRVTYQAPAQLPLIILGFKTPRIVDIEKDNDPYALEMLAAILSGHDAARFPKELVRAQRLAVSASASYGLLGRGLGFFYLFGSPSQGKSARDLENGFRKMIESIAKNGVAETELKRAKAQLMASETYKLDSMFSQAMEIGSMETIGFAHTENARMLAKLQAVSADDIKRVATLYFGDEQLTIGELIPQLLPKNAPENAQNLPSAKF